MVDIVLISPPSRMDNHYRPPFSLLYVASYYREQGMSVKIADFPFTEHIRNPTFWKNRSAMVAQSKAKMLNEVVVNKPKAVGISCYSTELDEVKELISDVRRISDAKIVVGGIHPTLKPEDFNGIADEVIRGRRDNGYACWDLIDMKHYSTPNPYAIRGVMISCGQVVSGFGCPSRCKFCVSSTLWEYFKGEQKPAQVLYDELVMLKIKYGIKGFFIIDDLYTINKARIREFCSLIKKTGLVWACAARCNTLDEETIKAMSKANCIQLDFGVERGSDRSLKELQKGITLQQIRNVFMWCKKYKVRALANFLVNIPGETQQDLKDIEKLIMEIKPTITLINVYQYYLGCKLGKQEASEELLKWKRKYMVKVNWRNALKFSSIWHSRIDSFQTLSLLVKEGLNQLCGR